MKRVLSVFAFLAGLYAALLILSSAGTPETSSASSTEQILTYYLDGLTSFRKEADLLQQEANKFTTGGSPKSLQTQLIRTRLAYKHIETFLEYYEPQAVKDYLNGPPLLSLERKSPSLNILEPEGLQVLDELIFAETPDATAILPLTERLVTGIDKLVPVQQRIRMYDRHVFEAIRFGLIRVFTLGLTGFDTPASGNALPEAHEVWKSLSLMLDAYQSRVAQRDPALAKELHTLTEEGSAYLTENQDFDSFDRLHFLITYVNPLFAGALHAQEVLEVETIEEVTSVIHSVNYHSENLFANDFLNRYYFMKVSEKEDSPALRSLGHTLFFDPILSHNNERSCASCHQTDKAFTDGVAKSIAMDFNGTVKRNAPTVINAIFADRYFHDLRATSLDLQTEHVIFNEKEFATDYEELLGKLQQSEDYMAMYQAAFPSHEQPVNKLNTTRALEAYVASLYSFNSPVDRYIRGETQDLSEAAKRGFNLFMGKASCGTCHFAPVFNGTVPPEYHESESEVLGVPANTDTIKPVLDADLGRLASGMMKEEAPFYAHAFKTVTVRNIALTAPYMHNGVYQTLEEVMDFYNKGGGAGLGLNLPNQTLPPDPLGLTQQEQQDIIAFMQALTDTTGLTAMPTHLPAFDQAAWNERKIGGTY